MRRIKYADYMSKRASFATLRAKLDMKKKSSSRVRDEEERRLLLELDKARLERWKKEGKLQVLGIRRYRFNV
ncbi:MAG TPA: hypothetical protein DCW86_02515 [Actinobacteria bacterium]|nr:hypothetical protein [Actinomycetota bacterium]